MKQTFGARFFITNVEWFNGDMDNILSKVVEKEATKQAKWIDDHIKRLLPDWVIELTPKYHKNRFFRYLIRRVFDIDISILSDPLKRKRIVTIGQRGKQIFSKHF